jgi:hypothetical protein
MVAGCLHGPRGAATRGARLADLVPPPRKHRHRYHGVFAPNHKLRRAVTSLAIGNVGKRQEAEAQAKRLTPIQRQRLARKLLDGDTAGDGQGVA